MPAPGPAPFAVAAVDAETLRARAGVDRFALVVVLGSGLGAFAEALLGARLFPMGDFAGFPVPAVGGHAGTIVTGRLDGHDVVVLSGRVHLYEGHSVHAVCHGVRVAAAAGAHTAVLTNAAGAIRPDLAVGSLVRISDHLNLSGVNPLTGPIDGPTDSPFVDLGAAYDPALRDLAARVAPGMADGVYAALAGPTYETPAEVAMLAALGADLVGMSTANETIACRHLGLRVAGLSLVTNQAAGLGPPLSHRDVTAVGQAAATDVVEFLRRFIPAAASLPEGVAS